MAKTIADNLQTIIDIKQNIKTAIKNKGVEVADSDSFTTYANKIESIETGGGDNVPSRVVEIIENGVYTTKDTELNDLDIPYGVSGYYDDGTPFFEYAATKRAFNTNIIPDLSTRIEFWFIDNEYNTFSQSTTIVSSIYEKTNNFGFYKDGNAYEEKNYVATIGNSTIRVEKSKINPNSFNHIIMSVEEGLWVNGEKIGDFNTTKLSNIKNIYIGYTQSAYYYKIGMVKINDVIIKPTSEGLFNTSTNELLLFGVDRLYTYEKYYELPPINGNLYRTIKVDVPPKINMQQSGLKLAYSNITEVPDWADWEGITDMENMFYYCSKLTTIPLLDTSKVTTMRYMFNNCSKLTTIPLLDTSKVTSMYYMFGACTNLTTIPQLDTSKVTDMGGMFSDCSNLTSISQLDTSEVNSMYNMFSSCRKLTNIPPLYAGNLTHSMTNYGIFGYNEMTALTDFGGLIDLKYKIDGSYGFQKCPNLTYQSCVNILNGLYDFTGNGETPTSNQGKLKVHSNFLTLVGDELSIGTNKGWIITT